MYFFICSLFLFIAFVFFRCRTTSLISTVLLPFIILNVYFDGEDWVNYLDSFEAGWLGSSPEIFFYTVLSFLKFITFGSYQYSIFLFFCFVFIAIYNLFHNKKHVFFYYLNRYYLLFLSLFVFSLGATLIMEQLRQLLALVLFMYAFSFFCNKRNLMGAAYMLLSALSHVSVVFLFAFVFLCALRINKLKFVILVSLLCSLIVTLCLSPIWGAINIGVISFLYDKVLRYLSVSVMGFGILHFFSLIYVLFYILMYNELSHSEWNAGDRFRLILARLAFSGCALYLCSSILPFLNRFSSYFIVIYILNVVICLPVFRVNKKFLNVMIIVVICISTGVSYYRNPFAPLPFIGEEWGVSKIIFDEYDIVDRYNEIKSLQLEKMQQYGYE